MNSRFIYGILSIVLAAILAFVAIPAVSARTNGKTEVVRVSAPIEKGSSITSDCLEVVEVGAYNLPDNIARTLEDVVGKYATADLNEGDFILSSKVAFTPLSSDIILSEIPSGQVAISITVKTLASGLSDKLLADDIIRFYHFLDFAVEEPALQFVRVIAVTDSKGMNVENGQVLDPNEETEKTQTATITVLATPYQAQVLTQMENEGIIHVALVSRGNAELAAELLFEQEEYFRILEEERLAAEAEANGENIDGDENSEASEGNDDSVADGAGAADDSGAGQE